jgi:hypothetical protein
MIPGHIHREFIGAVMRDHGHLEQRLRPMREASSILRSAETVVRGHALVQ